MLSSSTARPLRFSPAWWWRWPSLSLNMPKRRGLPPKLKLRPGRDEGMSTAEYAVATVAACAFAAMLYQVVTSSSVTEAMRELINRALTSPL